MFWSSVLLGGLIRRWNDQIRVIREFEQKVSFVNGFQIGSVDCIGGWSNGRSWITLALIGAKVEVPDGVLVQWECSWKKSASQL